EHLLQALSGALARGVMVLLLLPDNPNVGREFTDEGLKYLWEQAPQAVEQGRLQAYTLGSSFRRDERMLYRSIYVHSKVAIVDDAWITLGSANLNNRGMRDDTAMNVALMQPEIAQALRILLMTEHLGVCDEDSLFQIIEAMTRAQHSSEAGSFKHFLRTWLLPRLRLRPGAASLYAAHMTGELGDLWIHLQSLLGDPLNGMMLFAKQAKENLLAIKSSQAFIGHLLPYIPYARGVDYGINVHVANGWLDRIADA
nr:phospholipase D-like domain-containing protein [Chloroflexota bacterium]